MPWKADDCEIPMYIDDLRFFARDLSPEEIEAEAYGALGATEPNYVRLGCVNCKLGLALKSCPEEYHLCYSVELHSGVFSIARAQGWTDWSGHVWA